MSYRPRAETDQPLSIAPLVDHSDRHFRFLYRLIAPRATVYTPMLVAQAIVLGHPSKLLNHSIQESPVVAQLGGSDPHMLGEAAKIAEEYGFDAVNLNLGCPSPRVKQGGFGALLMERQQEVVQIVRSMKHALIVPLTVKCRIGTDQHSGQSWLSQFIQLLVDEGVDALVAHARIADLNGKSTSYNLNVPPLDYDEVKSLQETFPSFPITLNGGLHTEPQALKELSWARRIMVGRMALTSPRTVANLHNRIYNQSQSYNPFDIAQNFRKYMKTMLQHNVPLHAMTRHILRLFSGLPGAKKYREYLSTQAIKRDATIQIFDDAVAMVSEFSTNRVDTISNKVLVSN